MLCGWRVRSELALPELVPWRGSDIAADITVRFGAVPRQLPDLIAESPFLQIGRDGTCLLTISGVGDYLIARDHLVISAREGATSSELRLFLLGSALGILCHQRGRFIIHASSVSIGGRSIAFAGRSGAGKSTLAAAFARAGHRFLSDDVCLIDTEALGGPVVLPAFPRLKLWRDSLMAANVPLTGLERNRTFQDKYHYVPAGGFDPTPVPLAAIVILDTAGFDQPATVERIERPADIMRNLHAQVYRASVAHALGRDGFLFRNESRLAEHVPLFHWLRQRDMARLNDDIELLADLLP